MHGGRRFRLGLLALVAGVAFFGLLAFVLQGALGNARVSYFIVFEENVKGMVIGSKVNFQGVPIGMVQDIRFQGGKTLVEVTVDPRRADIQDVTLARLDRLLVTGQVTVELEGWGEGRSLVPGEYIQTKTDPINQLTKTLPELVPQIGSVLERIDSMLNQCNAFLDEDNRGHVAAILKSTDATLAALPAAIEQGRSLMSRADAVLTELEATSFAIRTEVTAVGGESRAMIAAVRAPLQSAIANARGSLDELRGFMRQLRLAPDSLLFGVNRPAAPAGSER
jgi:phospholipid/cholesterol/gamma-HCH transport system substrate-binding protein